MTRVRNPIPYATVFIVDIESNENITGTSTDDDGKFIIKSNRRNFYIEVSFIGYESLKISDIALQADDIDIGIIALKKEHQVLDEVELRAEKSSTEFKLDRRVFNVGKDLSSTGMGSFGSVKQCPIGQCQH